MSNATDLTILGINFAEHRGVDGVLLYSALNFVVSSVIPVPLAAALVAVGALVWGIVWGLLLNVVSTSLGAWFGLCLTRGACRPVLMRALGRYRESWQALDSALSAEGWQIALLIRLAPVAPLVVSNILLSLTSIRQRTYVWTTFVGTIPSNLPFAYAAQLGLSLANEFPPKDPVVLTMTIVGFIASALVAWKIGRIARRTLRKHGVDLGGRTDPTPAAMGAAAEELGHDIGGACDGGGGSCGGEGAEGTGRGRDKRGLLAAGALSSSQPVPEDAELLAPTSVSSPAASAPASDVELEAPPPR